MNKENNNNNKKKEEDTETEQELKRVKGKKQQNRIAKLREAKTKDPNYIGRYCREQREGMRYLFLLQNL